MTLQLLHGDCRTLMGEMPEASVDSVVCDPPYELTSGKKGGSGVKSVNLESPYGRSRIGTGEGAGGFMGMKWDSTGVAFDPETWRAALRVLKPGGYLLAFSGTRTYHRMVCAIEDAGFEIRDQIGWVYGSGFPKSHNGEWGGTALKPAWEPICMARKPLIGTVEANWREHGTGALNIDGCRVETAENLNGGAYAKEGGRSESQSLHGGTGMNVAGKTVGTEFVQPAGRWPANLIHDGSDEVLACFPDAVGQIADASSSSRKNQNVYGDMKRGNGREGEGEPSADSANGGAVGFKMKPGARRADAGSAARFFASFPQESSCHPLSADTVPSSSSLQSVLAASVQSAVAIWPSLAGIHSSDLTAPSTSVTANESRTLCESVITAMVPIGCESSHDSLHEKRTPCGSLVSVAVTRSPTGITTITASLLRSDGSVAVATSSITPTRLDLGGKDSARFNYCAKASKSDRGEGNTHPTVKPTDLMRYLCRLVTPAGGLVLDPFMGSGSTGKAARAEGLGFIGCELSLDYLRIAEARITGEVPLW